MNLYEVTNGYLGMAYTRCYVWAEDEEDALLMARKAFKREAKEINYDDDYYTDLKIERLMAADDAPFCTVVSSEGWERE